MPDLEIIYRGSHEIIIFPYDYLSESVNTFLNGCKKDISIDQAKFIERWNEFYKKYRKTCVDKYKQLNKIGGKSFLFEVDVGKIIRLFNNILEMYDLRPLGKIDFKNLYINPDSNYLIDIENIKNIDFENAHILKFSFKNYHIDNVSFENATLDGVSFENATLDNTSFKNATLDGVSFENAIFPESAISLILFAGTVLKNVNFKNTNLKSVNFTYTIIEGVNFKNTNLKSVDFTHSIIGDVNFNFACLESANFSNISINNAKFWNANLNHSNLSNVQMMNADFRMANLSDANMSHSNFQKSDFWMANLDKAKIWGSNLSGSDFYCATMNGTQFWGSDISYCMFCMRDIDGTSFQFSDISYSEFWAVSIKNANFIKTKLNHTYFGNAHQLNDIIYDGVRFSDDKTNKSVSNLEGALFNGSDMISANMEGIILKNAELKGVNLDNANLHGANLKKAKLSNSTLKNANLHGANLKDANFSHANITGAILNNVDMRKTKFHMAIVDGNTVINVASSKTSVYDGFLIDDETDFTGVNLNSAIISPRLYALLERNIREIHWREWYHKEKVISFIPLMIYQIRKIISRDVKKPNKLLSYEEWRNNPAHYILNNAINLPVRYFWKVSNYGGTTWTIFFWFMALNLMFCIIYIFMDLITGSSILVDNELNPLLYFIESYISTIMLMVNFNTNNENIIISLIMLVHKIMIYFILAALATRFGVLFRHLSP